MISFAILRLTLLPPFLALFSQTFVLFYGVPINHWITGHIYKDTAVMTEDDCKEVLDILDMFRTLKNTYNELSDKSEIDEYAVDFAGFDGNNETKYLGYTCFLIDKEKGKAFQGLYRGDNFNSHAPSLDSYRRMLSEWKNSPKQYELTKDDLVRITAARRYPSMDY